MACEDCGQPCGHCEVEGAQNYMGSDVCKRCDKNIDNDPEQVIEDKKEKIEDLFNRLELAQEEKVEAEHSIKLLENRIKFLESIINKERKEKPEVLEGEESAKKESQKYKKLYEEAVQRYSKSKQKVKHLQLALHTTKGRNAQDQTSKVRTPGPSS